MAYALAVLLPTCDRLHSLIFTLSGLAGQTLSRFHLIVADQGRKPAGKIPWSGAPRILRPGERLSSGNAGDRSTASPSSGDFLLTATSADMVLFLDDDVFMEPWVLERLVDTLMQRTVRFCRRLSLGAVLSHDVRPEQQHIEYWEGPVRPEAIGPGNAGMEAGGTAPGGQSLACQPEAASRRAAILQGCLGGLLQSL